jgi:hypothetical protein
MGMFGQVGKMSLSSSHFSVRAGALEISKQPEGVLGPR